MTHQDKNGAVLQPLSSNQLVWLALTWLADYIGFKSGDRTRQGSRRQGCVRGSKTHVFAMSASDICSTRSGIAQHGSKLASWKKQKNGPLRFPDRWRILTRRHCQLKLVAVPFEQVRKPAV